MAFSGSDTILKELIKANITPIILKSTGGDAQATDAALGNLDEFAGAISTAIVAWILQAGVNSIVAQVGPGIAVATAGSPAAQTGATTAPGSVIQSSLI